MQAALETPVLSAFGAEVFYGEQEGRRPACRAMDRVRKSKQTCTLEWKVDPLKRACLLRLADAIHRAARRAPAFLFAIKDLSAESRKHWGFQSRLHQPIVEGDRLVYSSGQAFPVSDRKSVV